MPFNTAKCELIAFNKRGSLPRSYKICEHSLNYVGEIMYLGIVMQSNLKFNRHLASKVNRAKKVLGCITYALNDALQPAKHLAYSMSANTQVCRCSMGSSRRSLNTRTQYKNIWDSTKQSNKICQAHQRATWHHRMPDSSWTTRAKEQKKVSQICTDDQDPFRRWETCSTLLSFLLFIVVKLWTVGTRRYQWQHAQLPEESSLN